MSKHRNHIVRQNIKNMIYWWIVCVITFCLTRLKMQDFNLLIKCLPWEFFFNNNSNVLTILSQLQFLFCQGFCLRIYFGRWKITTLFMLVICSWWRHLMETFSALLAICAGNSSHKGQWRGALMFSLICIRTNGRVNNGEAGDLSRHSAHYDVTLMY